MQKIKNFEKYLTFAPFRWSFPARNANITKGRARRKAESWAPSF